MARLALVLTILQLAASAATFGQQVFVARAVGATEQTDGYQIALALVIFFLQGLIMGALVNAFVPQLAKLARDDVSRSRHYAFWAQLNVLGIAAIGTTLFWVTSPTVIGLTAAGLSQPAHHWAVESLRIMVVATPFAALNGVYTSCLYVSGDLKFVAFAQIIQNVVAAGFSVVGFSVVGFIALPLSLAVGTLAGSFMLLGRLHRKSLVPRRHHPYPMVSSGSILRAAAGPLAAPLIGSVPGFVERSFMSFFPVGQVAILAYSGRIFSVALAFGVSVGVVALARWSGSDTNDNDGKGVAATSRSAAIAVLFATLPGTIALIMMPDVVVGIVFGDTAMDRSQLVVMTEVLSIYSLSLVPMALIGVIMRGFYAAEHPRSALGASSIWVCLWVALDVALVPRFGIYGLAVASTVAIWLTLTLVLIRWRSESWLSVWFGVLRSRDTLAIGLSSVISMTVATEVFHHLGPVWGFAAMPFVVVMYVAMSAVGGSMIARNVLHVVDRSVHWSHPN